MLELWSLREPARLRLASCSCLGLLDHVESVHDGPDPADDAAGPLAEAHGEGEAGELLLVAAGGGGEAGAGSGPEDVEDQAENGGALGELTDGVLALVAADFHAAFVAHRDFCFL